MRVWALANQKGGTGKTTTAINLAAALTALGKRCLVIDLDPQAHATLGLGVAVERGASVARVFLDGQALGSLVQNTVAGFHLLPAEPRLAEFEEVAERSLQPERVLRHALREVETSFDWVLLDCPPRAGGVLCANAMRASDTVLLVVETGAFSMQGALHAQKIFAERAEDLTQPAALKVLATLYERDEPLSREFLIALQSRFGDALLETVIRRDERLREAAAFGLPVNDLDPGASGTHDYAALAREVLRHRRAPKPEPSPLALSSTLSGSALP